eukprot:567509-Pleurochrysis_carterae.AAC.1
MTGFVRRGSDLLKLWGGDACGGRRRRAWAADGVEWAVAHCEKEGQYAWVGRRNRASSSCESEWYAMRKRVGGIGQRIVTKVEVEGGWYGGYSCENSEIPALKQTLSRRKLAAGA